MNHQRSEEVLAVGVTGENHDGKLGQEGLEPERAIDAAQVGQTDVHDHDVGADGRQALQCFGRAVARVGEREMSHLRQILKQDVQLLLVINQRNLWQQDLTSLSRIAGKGGCRDSFARARAILNG